MAEDAGLECVPLVALARGGRREKQADPGVGSERRPETEAADRASLPALVELAFDMTGSNTSRMVGAALEAAPGSRLESRPMPAVEVPHLMAREPRFISMAGRARKLLARGLPLGDFVLYNNGDDAHRYNAAEALLFERRAIVCQPLATVE